MFRPARGLADPAAFPGNRSTPEPQLVPPKSPLHTPCASDAAANRQRATSEPGRGLKRRHTPEAGAPGQSQRAQQPAKQPRLSPEHVKGRSMQSTPEPDMPPPTQKVTAQQAAERQRTPPRPTAQRSARSTPEQDAQALRRPLQQPGRPKSALPCHLQPGQLAARPPAGSSREATPEAGFGSSSSGLSTPKASRDKTPQQGLGLPSLHGPTSLSRPGSTANLPGGLLYAALAFGTAQRWAVMCSLTTQGLCMRLLCCLMGWGLRLCTYIVTHHQRDELSAIRKVPVSRLREAAHGVCRVCSAARTSACSQGETQASPAAGQEGSWEEEAGPGRCQAHHGHSQRSLRGR